MRIVAVSFYCLNKAMWDDTLVSDDTYVDPSPPPPQAGTEAAGYEHPCASIRKLLGTGTFYFAQDGRFDLSQRFEKRQKAKAPVTTRRKPPAPPLPSAGGGAANVAGASRSESRERSANDDGGSSDSLWHYDARFVWNTYMMEPLLEYRERLEREDRAELDRERFFILAIQGYIGIQETLLSGSTIALVSRLSWKRAGTRYNTRGVDDDGNVANFAESETLFSFQGITMSYCQVRGSVPLFWEQQGLQTFNARIQVTRPRIASQPAFDRHFSDLLQHYSAVHAINLLGTRDAETVLSSAYADHMRNSSAEEVYQSTRSKLDEENGDSADLDRIGLTNFDFHATSRMTGGLDGVKAELKRLGPLQTKRKAFGYTLYDASKGLVEAQRGVFRTNCLDCLDRTNVVEDIISQAALELLIERHESMAIFRDMSNPLWVNHRVLWAENGDALSKIYAGTGALNTSYTRSGGGKKTLGGLLSDAAKSASRMYINNFQDKSKQNVIDALLGNMANQKPVSVWDPLHDAVNLELSDRMDEYSTRRQVDVFTGTWNLAGRAPSGESLDPFLFPKGVESADVYALGLQEVVPLNAQQILMTDPDKLRAWESVLVDSFARRAGERYILLRSEQLVGTALVIFLRESLVGHIRQVEASTKKTGLKGMSGNKGGVAIRMNIFDTSFCFITAHFAAGKSNVEERNGDFSTISRELHFNSGRSINNSNHCFWFGDFNYRLEGGNDVVRPLCEEANYAALAKRDQLVRAKTNQQAFVGYKEAELTFAPTYKYDFMRQVYDTSEKLRVPAWTDRVLYKNQHPFDVELVRYSRAELLTSDHRPVYARFRTEARVFDGAKRNGLRRELLVKHKAEQARFRLASEEPSDRDSDDQSDEEHDEEAEYTLAGLPDPSTETTCWWNDSDVDESALSDDYDGLDVPTGNPFQSRVQYATRQSAVESPAVTTVSSTAPSLVPPRQSPVLSPGLARRPAPKPPATAALASPSHPPPIPRKPRQLSAQSQQRPGLGPRSQSYASAKSAKSLLDDSSDEA